MHTEIEPFAINTKTSFFKYKSIRFNLLDYIEMSAHIYNSFDKFRLFIINIGQIQGVKVWLRFKVLSLWIVFGEFFDD